MLIIREILLTGNENRRIFEYIDNISVELILELLKNNIRLSSYDEHLCYLKHADLTYDLKHQGFVYEIYTPYYESEKDKMNANIERLKSLGFTEQES